MPRRQTEQDNSRNGMLDDIVHGRGPFGSEQERLAALALLRQEDPTGAVAIDCALLGRISEMDRAINIVEREHEQLRAMISRLTAPPYFPAIFLAPTKSSAVEGAIVQMENERRVVHLGEGVCADQLEPGDEVFLTHERNCLIAKSTHPSNVTGEVATFCRAIGDGRMVVRLHEEEIVAIPQSSLRAQNLKAGDGVRLNRNACLAFEKIEASEGNEYFVESTPPDTFAEIGGLDRQIEQLKRLMTLHILHAGMTSKYKLPRKKSVLMEGPPGNGKTKIARATCNWLATLSPSGRSRFINIKPGSLNSMWFGATEERIREVFRIARDSAAAEPDVPLVMFWDEIDSIGGHRGDSFHRVDDRILNAFMAELNGLEDRGNIVILAATNRLDSIDPALLRPGRLGDLVLHVPQPGSKGARAILARHLPEDIPYAAFGERQLAARDALLDLAIAQLYLQSTETELANITLRDGKHRLVRAADLVSGAQLESIAQSAIERACVREAESGPVGVSAGDMSVAVADFFQSAPRALTPRNARSYLRDLPQDVDVVRVDLIEHKVREPRKYRVEAA